MARIAVYFLFAIFGLAGCAGSTEDETVGWSAQRLYGEAKDAMSSKDWPRAVKYLEKLEARYPYGRFAQQAQLEIAYCHYKDGERPSAVAAVDRFIKMYPNHASADYAWYLKGLINFNDQLGFLSFLYSQDPTERDPKATREAFAAFKALDDKFPNSKSPPDSLQRMNSLINAMAQYEVHVANYYYRRGAYLAALNRAQDAVTNYSDAPAREEALFLMIRAYDKLGMPVLRDDTQRVFTLNYPNSRFLNPNAKGEAPWWQFWSKAAPKPAPKDAVQ